MRTPEDDRGMAESDIVWTDIPLGPGQLPSVFGHFQFTKQGDWAQGTDVRRHPDYDSLPVTGRWPERPVW